MGETPVVAEQVEEEVEGCLEVGVMATGAAARSRKRDKECAVLKAAARC